MVDTFGKCPAGGILMLPKRKHYVSTSHMARHIVITFKITTPWIFWTNDRKIMTNNEELIGGCCVCSDDQGFSNNALVYCDGKGCTVACHTGKEKQTELNILKISILFSMLWYCINT